MVESCKRVKLKYSYHNKEIIMWLVGGVSKCYGGNHIVIYKYIKSTCCIP